jgi:hypothetical protein
VRNTRTLVGLLKLRLRHCEYGVSWKGCYGKAIVEEFVGSVRKKVDKGKRDRIYRRSRAS